MHYSEDIISGQPAKTVLQNMQMRARTDAYKNRPFCYSFCYSMSNIADNHWDSRTAYVQRRILSEILEVPLYSCSAADSHRTILGPGIVEATDRKSSNVQSCGIKFERIDRDLLWVYVTAVGRLYI